MSGRATRSKQRAAEAASASPARSTRSAGGSSLSPVPLSVGLRSSSPASLRSASPSTSGRNLTASKQVSARGRGRGKGKSTTTPPRPTRGGRSTQKTISAPKQTDETPKPRGGRAGGRGGGRGRASNKNQQSPTKSLSPSDNEESVPDCEEPTPEICEPAESKLDDGLTSSKTESVEIENVGKESTEPDACVAMVTESSNDNKVGVLHEAPVPLEQTLKSGESDNPNTAAAEIAEIANHLASDTTDQWPSTDVDGLTFTEEHIKQLESVLSSEEGLKLLTDQAPTEDDMNIDDDVIKESMQVDPALIAQTLAADDDTEVLESAEPESEEPESDQLESAMSYPLPSIDNDNAPRRRSERVTDQERRALVDKIREENKRKEKELLEKLKAQASEQETTKPTEDEPEQPPATKKTKTKAVVSEKPSTGNKSKNEPTGSKVKETASKTPPSKKSTPASANKATKGKQAASKSEKLIKGTPKKMDTSSTEAKVESPAKDAGDVGGWIPGKIKVIDRKSDSSEKDGVRLKKKSQELKRRLSSAADDLFKPDEPVSDKKARREKSKVALRDDEVSGGETSSESDNNDDDDEWMEEDDPDRLWCVCRKPHDNRFMICCDRCEEWYHGDCVGLTRKRGKQMEDENEEYICSQCKEKELVEKMGGVDNLQMSTPVVTSSSQADLHEKGSDRSAADTSNSAAAGDVKEENVVKLKGEIRKKDSTSKTEKRKKFVFQPRTPRQHCIGSGCENWAEDSKIYCSLSCISRHAKESLKIIAKEKSKTLGHKQETSKMTPDIVVMERHTGRLVTGAHAPTAQNLVSWLAKHPSFEVLRPGQQTGHVSSSAFYGKQKSKLLAPVDDKSPNRRSTSTKEEEAANQPKKSAGPDTATIRSNVRKSLIEILKERSKEINDSTTDDDIKSTVSSIEHELHKYYGDTNNKYKSRYRSLIFNIRDPKNKGLFRKILKKKLKPAKLVRMTPDELASKELHQWREKEMQSEIEKIKADEERKATMKSTLRKLTHKGEIEVEEETYRDMNTRLQETVKDYDMDDKTTDPHYDHESVSASRLNNAKQSSDLLASLMGNGDTTSQHGHHLFDSNCKICTGKQAAPTGAELERRNSKSVKVSSAVKTVQSAPKTVGESSREEIDKVVNKELKELEKDIEVFKEEDKMIAEKLEQRRRSHQEAKSQVRRDSSPKQEPSSTVQSPLSPLQSLSPAVKKRQPPSAWKGFIDVADVCKFFTTAHGVHGNSDSLKTELPDCLQIVGRIRPYQVWEYISQLKQTVNKDVILVRFSAVNEEEKVGYRQYFKYLSENKRFGVVGNGASIIKDMYIIPLPSQESLPTALKPFRHKALADDNRPNMLVGLIIRSNPKRTAPFDQAAAGKKSRKSEEDEPYEPPGIDDITAAEPDTPSPMTTPKTGEALLDSASYEEYDPTQPLVSLSAPGSQDSQDDMDTNDRDESYDPIVSAYSLADPKTLNAEDMPGAAPYSPGEHDMDLNDDADEPYDPTAPLVTVTPPSVSQSPPSTFALPKDLELTAQQKALKELTEQVERERKQLELHRALLVSRNAIPEQPSAQNIPKSMSDIMSGKTIPNEPAEPQQLNMMEYLKRKIASEQSSATAAAMTAPPLPPAMTPSAAKPPSAPPPSSQPDESERPKISFSLPVARSISQSSQRLTEEESAAHKPYLPPRTVPSRPNQQPLLSTPPSRPPLLGHIPLPSEHPPPQPSSYNHPADPRSDPTFGNRPDRLPFSPAVTRDPRGTDNYRGGDANARHAPYDDRSRWQDNERGNWRDADYRDRGSYDQKPGQGYQRPGGAYNRGGQQRGGYNQQDQRYRRGYY